MRRLAAAILGAAIACAPAGAATFTATYVFGDSLSDRGNAAEFLRAQQIQNGLPNLGHLPTPPYYHDSFTNGDVAVQVLANRYGLNADASLFTTGFTDVAKLGYTSGTNYAVAGATAADGPGIGQPGGNLSGQIGAYLGKATVADPNALYTVFIGGNDVRYAAENANAGVIGVGVATEVLAIQALFNAGAQHLLVVNVPDIGKIPEYALSTTPTKDAAVATADTIAYNSALTLGLGAITKSASAKLYSFDLFKYDTDLRANAASIGVTDVTDPCYTSYPVTNPLTPVTTSAACGPIDPATKQATNISSLYYWDDHHPTAKVQAALGNALFDFVQASEAPEPATWAMMIAGFGMTGAALRRRRAVPAVA